MPGVQTETETVIKRILPYLRRRGYEPETDIDFETAIQHPERYAKGYVDLLVTCGNVNPLFVIEAKRSGKNLTLADAKQALGYGTALHVTFVAVTNGQVVRVYNTATGQPLQWNGKLADKIPAKEDMNAVVAYLRRKKDATNVPLGGGGDVSLPFRPALPRKQLNDLFSRCHNKIRNIEKNEEHAFADFSKILFLKLLEEKADESLLALPYSYRFWELAEYAAPKADQVKSAVLEMLTTIKKSGYGDVLSEDLHLKNPATFRYIVQELAKVSFADSDYDVKGSAFEYFVRATLKGKKLGQYFTPRPVIEVMVDLLGREAILTALLAGADVRLADPACGTGGFLVYFLKASLAQLDALLVQRKITRATRDVTAGKLMGEVFHGADANDGVASAAKMNMIIAGDGHNNITCENSLLPAASLWPMGQADYDYILTNPPFGTAEGDSLSSNDAQRYPVAGVIGQYLFLQRMVDATKPGGLICTVIDEGLLNTDSGKDLRAWVMKKVKLLAVLHLPEETFRPNKISIRSGILLMRRRDTEDADLLDDYPIAFARLGSLGYYPSGEPIRGFDFQAVRESLAAGLLDYSAGAIRSGAGWRAFDVMSTEVAADGTKRWDGKYWEPEVRALSQRLIDAGGRTLRTLNALVTDRGRSPDSAQYVDEPDGYAIVIKAGSCISKIGNVMSDGADWVEKATFDDMPDRAKLQVGDVVLASTGEGTLGKAAVYDLPHEAVADKHVTIIRVDPAVIDPYYLADYLRCGFGQAQIQRLYTGSTNMIELTPDEVNRVVVAMLTDIEEQRRLSAELRAAETAYAASISAAAETLSKARRAFGDATA